MSSQSADGRNGPPEGVRDERKGLGLTGREPERGKKLTLVILTCRRGYLPFFSYFPPPPFLYEQI